MIYYVACWVASPVLVSAMLVARLDMPTTGFQPVQGRISFGGGKKKKKSTFPFLLPIHINRSKVTEQFLQLCSLQLTRADGEVCLAAPGLRVAHGASSTWAKSKGSPWNV